MRRTHLPRWFATFVARPRVSALALRLATVIDRPLMRWSGGRLRLSFVIPLVLLRVRGARSGALREVPLLCVPDGDDLIVVASNGGRPREPAWAHNLRAHRDVEGLHDGRCRRYRAEELAGSARSDAWMKATAVYPGYDHYADRASRPIAVFRLCAEGEAA
ncbi:MAG: nitroreductase/quinone reductase family protein [Pseudomonadales bacterium]|jgi:deazaflavin-dependent oxidoreductase (nitroreductase family)|nr:nitroreductase/quinone reductase family protein [Pseudomonadales bacterium]